MVFFPLCDGFLSLVPVHFLRSWSLSSMWALLGFPGFTGANAHHTWNKNRLMGGLA
jgi:hypothetical protein